MPAWIISKAICDVTCCQFYITNIRGVRLADQWDTYLIQLCTKYTILYTVRKYADKIFWIINIHTWDMCTSVSFSWYGSDPKHCYNIKMFFLHKSFHKTIQSCLKK